MTRGIKELSLTYDPVNSKNTFTNGDVINGRVTLETTKEVKIESLHVKCKGEARTSWWERRNNRTYSYSAHERYFKLKQLFIQDPSKKGNEEPGTVIITEGETYSNVVKPGSHVYPFRFQLPNGNFPTSFNGDYGSVKYTLEVTLDRSWKMDKTEKHEFTFVPRIHCTGELLMNPQSGAIDKKMKLFTSGSASVKAIINKMGYKPGETIKISSSIENSSSRDLKLKYSLDETHTFFAEGHSKHAYKNILKVVGDPIPAGSKEAVNTDIVLNPDMDLTISNCGIIKVEYLLKVYLDVPYASDPEVVFPVVILPPGVQFAPWPNQAPGGAGWSNTPPQMIPEPNPPSATFGPAPVLYPNIYSPNPEAPPPSYAEIYPNPNQTAPGFNPAPSAPAFNPPQYPAMGYPNPAALQQHPAPSGPVFSPDPTAPGMVPTGGGPGYWTNSTSSATQPEPYPTKTPEKQ